MSLQVRLLRSIPPTSLRLGVAVVAVVVAVMVVVVAVVGYALHQSLRLNRTWEIFTSWRCHT